MGKPRKVVVHWVANPGSTATNNRNYFENLRYGTRSASAHYIVGLEGEIIQCIPENEVAYHAGNRSMNNSSIGIEVCHRDWSGRYSETTRDSLIRLLAQILKRCNLGTEDIIRHYDVTGKDCPKYYVNNPGAWDQLKYDAGRVFYGTYDQRPKEPETTRRKQAIKFGIETIHPEVLVQEGTAYIPIRTLWEAMGYEVLWEDNTIKLSPHITKRPQALTYKNEDIDPEVLVLENHAYAPVRELLESMGFIVDWVDGRIVVR